MDTDRYSDEELSVLKNLFDACDADRSGSILINQLPGLLVKLGKTDDDIVNITEAATKIAQESNGKISFDDFASLLAQADNASEAMAPFEGPDPKVIEFLRILEEYRVKCEDEGNYLEAARALKQLGVLRKQEEKRQQKAIRARQISERQDVQLAHNMQFSEFNDAWDRYMEEYDNMAQMYIQQMTERHAIDLLAFQKKLRSELSGKPPKWSRELLEWRRRQHILARRKNYAEAQKIKKIADKAEEKEKDDMEQSQAIIFARKEAKYRQQQQSELQALLKRIEVRRKEHIKQRDVDSKRLLQRNRNVQSVLESKQTVECHRLNNEIKKNLFNNSFPGAASQSAPPSSSKSHGLNPAPTKRSYRANRGNTNTEELVDENDYNSYSNNNNSNGNADVDPPFMRAPGPSLQADGKDD